MICGSLTGKYARQDVDRAGQADQKRPAGEYGCEPVSDLLGGGSVSSHEYQSGDPDSVDRCDLNKPLNHIHPSDVSCPFNLSGSELQLWRQCRAADRGHQIASRGVSGIS